MARRENVILYETSGVDMRRNPLDLNTSKLHFARNISFNEGLIKSRPGFKYHKLNIKGKWQGGSYFSPSSGLSAASYSNLPNGLVNVVDGEVYVTPLTGDIGNPHHVGSVDSSENPVFSYDAENYLIVHVENGLSYWSDGGVGLQRSPGLSEYADDHDTLDSLKIKNWVPCNASVGAYVHGRLHVAVPFSCANTEIAVGDLITKRGCLTEDDLLHFTEHCNLSHGGGLSAPSRMGPTQALMVLPTTSNNGEGELFDFRKSGIVRHNTLQDSREARYDAEGKRIKEGWDTKRLTNVVVNVIGAVGRYAVYQLPNDILFRSQHGLHFLKRVIGEGTFNDETTNTISQDVEPLINFEDDSSLLDGSSVGHWLFGNRFFATVNHHRSEFSATSAAKGFVSFNQTYEYSEDRTPRFITEGVWTVDDGIADIHMFVQAGEALNGKRFGFICSDKSGELYFAEINNDFLLDSRDGYDYPIEWDLQTASFAWGGFGVRKQMKNGFLDAIVDNTEIKSYYRTDENLCWQEWGELSCDQGKALLTGAELGETDAGTYHQFRLGGKGYVEIRNLEVDWTKTDSKTDGKGNCINLCEANEKEDWF